MKTFKKIEKVACALLMVGVLVILPACQNKNDRDSVAYYTCPMHSQIKQDSPGQCPICSMNLIPVKKSDMESDSQGHAHAESHGEASAPSATSLGIDPVRLQRIGVQTAEVQIRNLSKEILIQGKVAHDPKLWVAQKEYLIALRLGDGSLIKSSEEKLRFLGLSKEWIAEIRKRRRADMGLHLPMPGQPSLLEAFINQSDLNEIHVGQVLEIYDLQNRSLGRGKIVALGTLLNMESRTMRVLVQSDSFLDLPSNSFVQFKITLDLGKRLAVPKSAILFNGDHNMVYVETSPGKFIGKKIQLGVQASDYYEVDQGLQVGEQVVVNGHFLIDSETQMRMGTSGGHQH